MRRAILTIPCLVAVQETPNMDCSSGFLFVRGLI